MNHLCNVELAKDYDINISVFMTTFNQISAHLEMNEVEGEHINYENNIYMRPMHFVKVFPYFSFKRLRTIINKCIAEGLLVKGDFNKNKFENTVWITISSFAMEYFK